MKRLLIIVPALGLCLMFTAAAFAGELEDNLYKAVNDCNTGQVQGLIRQGANVNAKVCSADGKECEIMLNWAYGADTAAIINREDQKDKDCMQVINMLKAAGANYSAGKLVDTLFDAAEKGNVATVKAMLDKGVDVNSRDNDLNATVLMEAASKGQTAVVELLIARGADVNASIPTSKVTALLWSALNDHPDTALVLIKHGADVNAICSSYTALMQAVDHADADFVELLIKHGADVNMKDYAGKTALGWAYEKIEKGNITNLDSNFNPIYTPLSQQERNTYDKIVRILKRAGAQ